VADGDARRLVRTHASLGDPNLRVGGRRRAAVAGAALAVVVPLVGCRSDSSSADSNAAVKRSLLRGVAQIRGIDDLKGLHDKLSATRRHLGLVRTSNASGRRARDLALRGFAATLGGIESQLSFILNDSGNVPGATEDAMRTARLRHKGANLLRAAGRALDVRIGSVAGY
jgi:hypothetical protein